MSSSLEFPNLIQDSVRGFRPGSLLRKTLVKSSQLA